MSQRWASVPPTVHYAMERQTWWILLATDAKFGVRSFHGNFRDVESIFHKQDRLSYQREFRFVIDRDLVSASPLILEIGDLRDITQRFDSAELNTEKFLGGEMAVPE